MRNCFNPSRPNPGQREKINLNLYFHTSLWCHKRSYDFTNPLRYHKEVRKYKFKLVFISIQLSEMHWAERVKVNYVKMTRNLTIRQNFTNIFTNKVYLRQGYDAIIFLVSMQYGNLDLVIQCPNY